MTNIQIKHIAVEQFNGIKYMYKEILMGAADAMMHKYRIPAERYPEVREAIVTAVGIHFPAVPFENVEKMFTELEIKRAENVCGNLEHKWRCRNWS